MRMSGRRCLGWAGLGWAACDSAADHGSGGVTASCEPAESLGRHVKGK